MKRNCLVGDTPLIKINYIYEGEERHLYAKLEYFNVTGSIKDRLVYYVLDKENVKPNMIAEATSGNTGIALAAYGARYNIPVHIFMPDFVSPERRDILNLYGTHLHLITREEGGFKECVRAAREFAKENNAYLFNQFDNDLNVLCHYNTTALEIIKELGKVDLFVSGIGTGGTLMGISKRLKKVYGTKCVALEPDSLRILSDSEATGSHKIDGIGDDFIPSIVNMNSIDKIVSVRDTDAINMAIKLSRELGIGVGVSSGANFIASVISSDKDDEVVTIFADDNKKYLSTYKESYDIKEDFISEKIKLVSFEVI